MGHHEQGLFSGLTEQKVQDFAFVLVIQSGGGFVKDDELRILEEQSGDHEPLSLSAGQADAVFSDQGLEPPGQSLYKVQNIGPGRPPASESLFWHRWMDGSPDSSDTRSIGFRPGRGPGNLP